jgi:tripartite-type tricarboxylate transporter receptor subunit TctC
MAKVKFVQVPYRGSAPALQGLLAGDVDIMFDNLGVSLPLVQSGKLKLIAVGTEKRMSALPDVPTIAETLPGFAASAWFAVVAPPKTPAAIAAKISADIAEAVRQPDIGKRLADLSAEPVGGTPAETAAFLHAEVERWKNVIDAANVKLE